MFLIKLLNTDFYNKYKRIEKLSFLIIKNKILIDKIVNEIQLKMVFVNFLKNKNKVDSTLKIEPQPLIIIHYIFSFNISNSNIILNITDTKGNTYFYLTSGRLNFIGSQKANKHTLLNLISNMIKYIRFFEKHNVALHFRGPVKKFNKLIIKSLKTVLNIVIIKSYNLSPHNGCRPKKLKRLKRFLNR